MAYEKRHRGPPYRLRAIRNGQLLIRIRGIHHHVGDQAIERSRHCQGGGEEGAARELSLSTVTFDVVAEDGKKKNTLLSLDRFFFQKWRRVGTLLYNNGFRVPHVEVQVPKLRLSA